MIEDTSMTPMMYRDIASTPMQMMNEQMCMSPLMMSPMYTNYLNGMGIRNMSREDEFVRTEKQNDEKMHKSMKFATGLIIGSLGLGALAIAGKNIKKQGGLIPYIKGKYNRFMNGEPKKVSTKEKVITESKNIFSKIKNSKIWSKIGTFAKKIFKCKPKI